MIRFCYQTPKFPANSRWATKKATLKKVSNKKVSLMKKPNIDIDSNKIAEGSTTLNFETSFSKIADELSKAYESMSLSSMMVSNNFFSEFNRLSRKCLILTKFASI
jgi:hypothetical protein